MANIQDYIICTALDNTDNRQQQGNADFVTRDFVYLSSRAEFEKMHGQKAAQPSDYAIMNGLHFTTNKECKSGTSAWWQWLRSSSVENDVDCVFSTGDFKRKGWFYDDGGICPSMRFRIAAIVSDMQDKKNFNLDTVYNENGDLLYHTIEFGLYPQNKTNASLSNTLEGMLYLENNRGKSNFRATGKSYCGRRYYDGTFVTNLEYEYKGKKYVRVLTPRCDKNAVFSDKTKIPEQRIPMWVEVQPIKWIIQNWDNLPKEINPDGDGRANAVIVRSEKILMSGIPFYPYTNNNKYAMWQNSTLRAMLNGYDLNDVIKNGNGNKRYRVSYDFNFKGKGFIQEAFNGEIQQEQKINSRQSLLRKTRLDKLNPDKTPSSSRRKMTDTEIIKSWIDAGQSVLLRGPSGIGKTERIRNCYPDLIYIKLTNNMFPEKVVGSLNLQTGQSIPPDFAKQALLSCATDAERKRIEENVQNLYSLADKIYERSKNSKSKVVIMLDELLNVKPAVQSLVYTLVLNRLVETGKGLKLPANTVIVATGNQKKYSSVAEDLVEPLEKRFDHIFDMQPKVGEWLYEYALPNKLHPAVISYIFSKYQESGRSEKISDMGYFYEEPEVGETHLDCNGCRGRTNDPRSWTSISRMLYAFEDDVQKGKFIGKNIENLLQVSIGSKLREEWAEEFIDFYNNPTLTVEEVVKKRYSKAELPNGINEKFATVAGLLAAKSNEVSSCREFIREYCDPEYVAIYDLYWAGGDAERMEQIAELQDQAENDSQDIAI